MRRLNDCGPIGGSKPIAYWVVFAVVPKERDYRYVRPRPKSRPGILSVMRKKIRCAFVLLASLPVCAADLRSSVEGYVATRQTEIVAELVSLLSIPNVAADRPSIRRNAVHLRQMLERRGLTAELLETQGNPLVYGERKVAGAARTVLFYMHYDGQPVDPSRWKQPSPFSPILRDGRMEDGAREIANLAGQKKFDDNWRVYARSASDDKSPIVALCAALDALKAAGREPTSNIRVILDGEEEAGSPSLTPAIGRYREKLQANLALILDGPLHPSGRPTLTFGARGVLSMELTVYGPKFALHSGHYGNWVPNPAIRLAQLLASMKDEQGRVLVEGFYDGVAIGESDRKILRAVPDDAEALKKLIGVARFDAVGESLQEAIQYPSLNIRGLRSGYVGAEARTIIPSEATAAIDVRLVKETPAARMREKVLTHIRKQGFHVVEAEPDDATRLKHPKLVGVNQRRGDSEAYRTEMSRPESLLVAQALEKMWGQPPVRLRTSGGTVPLQPFIDALGFPAIGVPTVNFDNNQHSENENLRLGHFFRAIVTMAALLTL